MNEAIKVATVLNKQLSNWTVMFMKLHNYHWFVTGPQFFELHAKFEELYNEASEQMDEIAERVLALKYKPVATLKEGLAIASIEEASGNETTADMIQQLIKDYSTMSEELREGIEISSAQGDEVSADMMIASKHSLEKTIWMLEAFAG